MREEKQLLLNELKGYVQGTDAFLVTKYTKLDPNEMNEFRETVSRTGGFYNIVKKRIFIKALAEQGVSIEKNLLEGHIGIVYAGEDTIAMTKAVCTFQGKNKDKIEVIAGRYDGKMCSPDEVKAISKLPSKDQMRAEFIGTLEAPMTQIITVLETLLKSPIYCLSNMIEKEKDNKDKII